MSSTSHVFSLVFTTLPGWDSLSLDSRSCYHRHLPCVNASPRNHVTSLQGIIDCSFACHRNHVRIGLSLHTSVFSIIMIKTNVSVLCFKKKRKKKARVRPVMCEVNRRAAIFFQQRFHCSSQKTLLKSILLRIELVSFNKHSPRMADVFCGIVGRVACGYTA